jgi:uncharacterized protein (TIGR00730 family)
VNKKRTQKSVRLNGIAQAAAETPAATAPGHGGALFGTSNHGIRKICVYCGSGSGQDRSYAAAARQLGKALATSGIGLVYGGGSLGLMGEVARATLRHGGHVTGIIPRFLVNRERMLTEVQELIQTDDMHQRKMAMFAHADAFVALPGGIGTLEELVEQLTWSQLGRHRKPIVLANIGGFWSPFLALLEHMRQESFIRPGLDVTFSVVDNARDIVPAAIALARTVEGAVAGDVVQKF